MELSLLTALSPLDGRYAEKIRALRSIFSEYGLIRHRLLVEIHWLIALSKEPAIPEVPAIGPADRQMLDVLVEQFGESDARRIKEIERETNHDVKAVEYFLKERLAGSHLDGLREFVHFSCTSEDINNLAYGLMMQEARTTALLPVMEQLRNTLAQMARQFRDLPMLARTHGQPASPTTLGKELANVVARLDRQLAIFRDIPVFGKINGAVGNFNAHVVAYPEVDWLSLSRQVVEGLGLTCQVFTTQIEPHDGMAEMFHSLMRFNSVMLDLCRDMWNYVSLGYFRQRTKAGEVGSSTMPHKVNPIDFENAEGNLGLANAMLGHLADKLPISRMQRDLSDSTVLRNVGVAYGYSLLAWQSALVGLGKLEVDRHVLAADLEDSWEVLAEAIQTVMRRYGVPQPYERLKALTRGQRVTRERLEAFLRELELPESVRNRLLNLEPRAYTGMASQLVDRLDGPV